MARKFNEPGSATFKVRIYFRDGNQASFFSRDWQGKRYQPRIGLLLLERYVVSKQAYIKYALIYDKRVVPDQIIRRYQDGAWVYYAHVEFN